MTAVGKRPRTALGFDFGQVRIGVAVGQELTATANPLITLPTRNGRPDWDAISRLIRQWRPDVLVVGAPRYADGGANAVTNGALRFSRQLHGRYNLPVETIDERLSSHEAESWAAAQGIRLDRGRLTVDALAAALILQSWFNQQRRLVRQSTAQSPDAP